MSGGDSLYGVDQDYTAAVTPAFAPTSGRVGQAPAASQGGRVALALGPTGKLSQVSCDANGNLNSVTVGPTGGPLSVVAGSAAGALSTQQGPVVFGRQDLPAPSVYQPVLMDQVGAVQVHAKSKPTIRAVIAQVASGLNKSLLSVYNGSTAGNVLRIQEVSVYITPQSVTGALLGSSSIIYYPVYCQMHRITSHATQLGSVTVSYVAADTSDAIDAGITMYSNAALTGLATQPYHRGDANNSGAGRQWYVRGDPNEKTLVLRPGQGMAVICVSSGLVANGTGGTLQAPVDVEVTLTQAPA